MAARPAHNHLYIPNLEEFFNDFLLLIEQSIGCLQGNANEGIADFLGRRLEEYHRSLRVMYGRLRDFRNNSPEVLTNFEQLLDVVSQIKDT